MFLRKGGCYLDPNGQASVFLKWSFFLSSAATVAMAAVVAVVALLPMC